MFRFIHHGRSADPKPGPDGITGLADFADWDEANCCQSCAAGGVQVSNGRVLAASLARCSMLTTTGLEVDADLLISESLRQSLMGSFAIELPVREIEPLGRGRAKERWWQVIPEAALSAEQIFMENVRLVACEVCGTHLFRTGDISRPADVRLKYDALNGTIPEPLMWAPGWYGELHRARDGRLLNLPLRSIYLRADLGAALKRLRDRNLDLIPIPWTKDGS